MGDAGIEDISIKSDLSTVLKKVEEKKAEVKKDLKKVEEKK